MSEIDNMFNEWKDKYSFPDHVDFELRTMLELEEQYKNTPIEHTKTRQDILEMLRRIKNRFHKDYYVINYKYRYRDRKDNKIILFVGNNKEQLISLVKILERDIYNVGIDELEDGYELILMDKKYIFKVKNSKNIIDLKADIYFNLTSDEDYENSILKPMLNIQ